MGRVGYRTRLALPSTPVLHHVSTFVEKQSRKSTQPLAFVVSDAHGRVRVETFERRSPGLGVTHVVVQVKASWLSHNSST